jgi:alpha-glucosidase
MRPMFLEFPAETDLAANDQEFMFGPDLLVVPQISETRDPLRVDLPAGTWYDYWTGKQVVAKSPFELTPKLDELPVFVRAGAILPKQAVIQHVEEIPRGPLELNLYPGPNCNGSLYSDDGNSFAYQRGVFFRTRFSCAADAKSLHVQIAKAEGTFTPWWKQIRLTVFGAALKPGEITLNGKSSSQWQYDPDHQSVSVLFDYSASGEELEITPAPRTVQ